MKFAETELKQITETTWKVVLGEELETSHVAVAPAEIESPMAACAQIVGDWQLGVLLYCSKALAQNAAGVMFGMEPANTTVADVQDTLCELINIITGNVKGVLSGNNHLSLPSVVNGSDFSLRFPRHVLLSEAAFCYGGEPLIVRLLGEDKLLPKEAPSVDNLPVV